MAAQSNQPLPDGYKLNEYTIEKLLSSGGFSIVYLARDDKGVPVAIKEYLPSSLVLRSDGADVKVNSEENLSVFRHGLKCFFEEGRALATISHPNIVRVDNFFRANETVYMVMQYVRGRTLQFHIQRNRQEFSEQFIRRLFTILLNGLREVHVKKLLHLDIKPANLYITMEGKPVLLDFGAARLALSQDAKKLRPMYTAGYAAPEQYRNLEQLGPWTDIYAVGAAMFACVTGEHPQPADEREKEDNLPKLNAGHKFAYSQELLDIVDWCMKLDPMARPQTAFELQKALTSNVREISENKADDTPLDTGPDSMMGGFGEKLKATLNKKLF